MNDSHADGDPVKARNSSENKNALYSVIDTFLILLLGRAVDLYRYQVIFTDEELEALHDHETTATFIYNAIPPQLFNLCHAHQPSIQSLWTLPRVTPAKTGVGVLGVLFKSPPLPARVCTWPKDWAPEPELDEDEDNNNTTTTTTTTTTDTKPDSTTVIHGFHARSTGAQYSIFHRSPAGVRCAFWTGLVDFIEDARPASPLYTEVKGIVLAEFAHVHNDEVANTHSKNMLSLAWRALLALFGLLDSPTCATSSATEPRWKAVNEDAPTRNLAGEIDIYASIVFEAAGRANWMPACLDETHSSHTTSASEQPIQLLTTISPNRPIKSYMRQELHPFKDREFERLRREWARKNDLGRNLYSLQNPDDYLRERERAYLDDVLQARGDSDAKAREKAIAAIVEGFEENRFD